jgi:hypothetical protein
MVVAVMVCVAGADFGGSDCGGWGGCADTGGGTAAPNRFALSAIRFWKSLGSFSFLILMI